MGKIGRYRVEAEIGRGAMGVVWLAYDPRLERRVALKSYGLLADRPEAEEPEFRERFEREARAAAALSHPGIVTVHDVDHDGDGGLPYIAMEYVEGESLEARLARQPKLDPAEACEIVLQLADALHAAHAAGIVHRDVKPANVLIRAADGRVKLADFGVARLQRSDLTRSGTTFGSPAYMAPEQIRGEAVDGRVDLFSLAVVLFRMLTGSAPFSGEDLPSLCYAIVHGEAPAPTRLAPELPAATVGFFERALAKSPEQRFADGRAFCDALTEAMAHDPLGPGEPTQVRVRPPDVQALARSRRRIGRWAAVAVGLLAAAALVTLVVGDDPAYLELRGRSTIESGSLTLFVDGEEVYRRELAFAGERNTLTRLIGQVRRAAGGETFEAVIETTAGQHEIEAVVTEAPAQTAKRSSVVVELDEGATEKLKLTVGGDRGSLVTLDHD